MYTVVGIVRKVGNFNGVDYDNSFLHCTREAHPESGESGTMVEILKVKTNLCSFVAIGDNIDVFYNKFGNITKIETL